MEAVFLLNDEPTRGWLEMLLTMKRTHNANIFFYKGSGLKISDLRRVKVGSAKVLHSTAKGSPGRCHRSHPPPPPPHRHLHHSLVWVGDTVYHFDGQFGGL